MLTETKKQIRIDLDQFKLHLNIEQKIQLSLHFDSPSRKFYLSVIAFVVNEMKKNGGIASISLEKHHGVLALLNETVGERAGSSTRENLIPRIYKKWKSALPDLENAPLFRIIGRKKEYGSGIEKAYVCSEDERDSWANLFDYKGSGENVRLRFSVDALGASLDNIVVTCREYTDEEAWERFVADLKKDWEAKAIPEKTVEKLEKAVGKKKSREIIWRRLAPAAIIVLIVVAVGLVSWNLYLRQSQQVEAASVDQMAYPLPEKPSIAVLPFDNMSGDPEQGYIADGLTENIITGLSLIPEMFVIACNSVFTYKGKPVKIKQVSEELGVRYVLEGSVQKAGNRLRVNAQLVDALKGHHLWVERYDRELKDLFKLQDEITIKVVNALQVKLVLGGDKFWFKTDNFDAWGHSVKGGRLFDRFTKEDNRKAREHVEQALTLDSDYAFAWCLLAWTHVADAYWGWSDSPGESIKRALEIAQKSSERWFASDRHLFLSQIYIIQGQHEKAIAEGEKAVAFNPNNSRNHYLLAVSLGFVSRPEEAIVHLKKAMRLEPYYPAMFLTAIATLYERAGRYEEALATFKELLERALKTEYNPLHAQIGLARNYARLDRMEEARAHAAEIRRIDPNFSVERYHKFLRTIYKDQEFADNTAEMMLKAGLPD